jgi:hypothetical protein
VGWNRAFGPFLEGADGDKDGSYKFSNVTHVQKSSPCRLYYCLILPPGCGGASLRQHDS